MKLLSDPVEAHRLARAILADAQLYQGQGAASLSPGSPAVEEGRALFRQRVEPALHTVFEAALAEAQAPGAPPASSPSSSTAKGRGKPRPALVALGLVVAVVAGVAVWRLVSSGEPVASVALPGEVALPSLAAGTLELRADTDVVFSGGGNKARPRGCVLHASVLREGQVLAEAQCDLYQTSAHTSIATGSTTQQLDGGRRRLEVRGQRLACRLPIDANGGLTLRVTSNLSECVAQVSSASIEIRHHEP